MSISQSGQQQVLLYIEQGLLSLLSDLIKLPGLATQSTAVHPFAAEISDQNICHTHHPAQVLPAALWHALTSDLCADIQRALHQILQYFIHNSIL